MTRFEQALRILEEEFDAFVILGSMYRPDTGLTDSTKIRHGNAYTLEAMLREAYDEQEYEFDLEEIDDGEEEGGS